MAAQDLIQDDGDVCIHVEANVTTADPPSLSPGGLPNGTADANANTVKTGENDKEESKICCFLKEKRLVQTLSNRLQQQCNYVKIAEDHGKSLPTEWWKTGVAFLYAVFNLFFTTVVITVVHERVPDKSLNPPLPDKFFDYIDRVPWAFTVTEVNGLILVALWTVQWIFLKHKAIVGRRCFFLIGTLYMYRCVTMYVTTLPVPGKHMVCAPKLNNDSSGKIWRILRLISGGGLSMTGTHLMCGDFLYSGHTVMLTLSYLFIREYSPLWMWWYRWACWFLSASGVVCILLGHEHYSVDVVVAYYITTRLFWWYHTMANTHSLRRDPNCLLSRTWWNPLFNFLERNVQSVVPIEFSWPINLPSSCRQRYKMVELGRDE
ncbi:phosphatidylcholine:ceramide cholinephosphotransferase 2-like [Eucyclogobius newberryi]|uniref:phosphatidylcholine:ceramide cholinephosphotransferase 2-like n=1 Tax=Eucyclogobius newberryi TaxID=166745 RepID=UPI003B5C618A